MVEVTGGGDDEDQDKDDNENGGFAALGNFEYSKTIPLDSVKRTSMYHRKRRVALYQTLAKLTISVQETRSEKSKVWTEHERKSGLRWY